MEWIKQRVWQLGIGILLGLIATVLLYLGGTEDVDRTMLWAGLILFFLAMAVPLFAKIFEATQENEGEEGET
jgi:NhaP-type Na+/H+ and K+/H+ antiporter